LNFNKYSSNLEKVNVKMNSNILATA